MTVLEAVYVYGTREYTISAGDSLLTVSRKLYGSESENAIKVLKTLNHRFDWASLQVGDTLRYLPAEVIKQISEV